LYKVNHDRIRVGENYAVVVNHWNLREGIQRKKGGLALVTLA
jgi:hypothetical protein